jgi:hypothetical protein
MGSFVRPSGALAVTTRRGLKVNLSQATQPRLQYSICSSLQIIVMTAVVGSSAALWRCVIRKPDRYLHGHGTCPAWHAGNSNVVHVLAEYDVSNNDANNHQPANPLIFRTLAEHNGRAVCGLLFQSYTELGEHLDRARPFLEMVKPPQLPQDTALGR